MSQNVDEQQANPEHQALIDQFVEISGINDRDRARFYLETAGYDLPLALSGFFEGGFDEDEEAPQVVFDHLDNDDEVQIIEEPEDDEVIAVSGRSRQRAEGSEEMSGRGGGKAGEDKKKKGIVTLFSEGGASNQGESSSDDEGADKGQAFYVGGSEKSGQQVLGPPKKKADGIAERFFKEARERGAEQVDPSQRAAASGGAGSSSGAFGGAGYRLGDAVKPAEKIGGAAMDVDQEEAPQVVPVIMRMWQNGFTIDDGPLRTFDTPEDRQFLEHIMQGRLPPELTHAHRGKRIDLEMEDHRGEEYKPPKRALKAFSGQGHTLGSPVPEVVGAGKVGEKPAASASSAPNGAAAAAAPVSLPVDESKPVTNIQIRLGNGERLVMKLNHTHTIKDVRQFIGQMRPDLVGRDFMLMANFPSKELADESVTLEGANLLNAVIIQRFK